MSSMIVKPPDDELAYEQIEAAVMETSRGRWFLSEYARRNRHAETVSILDAIEKLQKNIGNHGPTQVYDRLQIDIVEMARAVARTEREIRAIKPDGAAGTQFVSASDELDAVVGTTEQATSSILSAAEKVQEYAWTMRERSGNEVECDMLDACATEIYTACGFQDLTAQRIRKVVGTLLFLDQRLKSILEATGLDSQLDASEPAGNEHREVVPTLHASDIWMNDANQAEIDDTFDFFVPAAVSEPTMVGADLMEIEAETWAAAQAPVATRAFEGVNPAIDAAPATAPLADPYDALSTEEKMRAFR